MAETWQAVGDYIAERLLDCTAVQTVGSKGWDGFMLALVKG